MDDKLETLTKARCILCMVDCPLESHHQQADTTQTGKKEAELNFIITQLNLDIGKLPGFMMKHQGTSGGEKAAAGSFLPTLCDDCSRGTGRVQELFEGSKDFLIKLGEVFESLHDSIQARLISGARSQGLGVLEIWAIFKWTVEIKIKFMMKRKQVKEVLGISNGEDQSPLTEPLDLSTKATTSSAQRHPASSAATATGDAPISQTNPPREVPAATTNTSPNLLAIESSSSSENPSNVDPTPPNMSTSGNETQMDSSPASSSLPQTTPEPATSERDTPQAAAAMPGSSSGRMKAKSEVKREKGSELAVPYDRRTVARRLFQQAPEAQLQRADVKIKLTEDKMKLLPPGTSAKQVEDVVWGAILDCDKVCGETCCVYCGVYMKRVTSPVKHMVSKHFECIKSQIQASSAGAQEDGRAGNAPPRSNDGVNEDVD